MDKLRVLFVDDEPHILQGLRRSLSALDDRWDMTFCQSGAEALELMAGQPAFDAVVSDMRMPQMDGAEFLGNVRQRQPDAIRVILSGYADKDAILRTIGPAHVYLAKPCGTEALHAAVTYPLSLRHLLSPPSLRAILAGLSNLPSLPDLVVKLDTELRSTTCSAKVIAALIDQDVAMTAELLRLTNSSYFSVAGPVTSTLQAVRTIGIETIQVLVLQIGIFRQFAGAAVEAPVLEALTAHSLAIASLAEAIAVSMDADQPTAMAAHCAAMLSMIGILVLLDAYPERYGEMLSMMGTDLPLKAMEMETFGANHAMIGAYLLGLWGFTIPLIEAVAYGDSPAACPRNDSLVLTAVHAAMALGPPLIFAGAENVTILDMAYLIEARKDGLLPLWRKLAAKHSREAA